MTYKCEKALRDFDFWAGAAVRARRLTPEQLNIIEKNLEEMYGDEMPYETDINDFIWFEEETYLPWLDISEEEWDAM